MTDGLQSIVASATLTAIWALAMWFADRTGGPR